MSLGYNRPLYLLPFDHRHSYITGMCHFTPPLTAEQRAAVTDSKRVIYDGFREAIKSGLPRERAGILVDEEFGAEILRDATQRGYVTALSTETSGSTSLNSNTARHSRSTSKPSRRPSRKCWSAIIRRVTRRSTGGRRPC